MNPKAKNILKYTLSFLLAAVLVWFAFRKVDWKDFLDGLRMTRWAWMALFALASIAAVALRMIRWKGMLEPVEPEVDALRTWDAANIGNLVNVVLPGAGELVRCGYVSRKKGSYEKVFGTVLMERMWDMAAIAVLLICAVGFGWKRFGSFFIDNIWKPAAGKFSLPFWGIMAVALLVAVILVIVIFRLSRKSGFFSRVADKWRGFLQGLVSFTRMERKWAFGACTAGIWIMYVLMSWCALKAIPALSALTFTDALFISAAGNIASVIPVPGGIGAYHYLIALIVSSLYGASWDTGLLFATLNHESHAILVIILGVISYIRISVGKKSSV